MSRSQSAMMLWLGSKGRYGSFHLGMWVKGKTL